MLVKYDKYPIIDFTYAGYRIPLAFQVSPSGFVLNVFMEPHGYMDISKVVLDVCNLINELLRTGDTLEMLAECFGKESMAGCIVHLALAYEKKARLLR